MTSTPIHLDLEGYGLHCDVTRISDFNGSTLPLWCAIDFEFPRDTSLLASCKIRRDGFRTEIE